MAEQVFFHSLLLQLEKTCIDMGNLNEAAPACCASYAACICEQCRRPHLPSPFVSSLLRRCANCDGTPPLSANQHVVSDQAYTAQVDCHCEGLLHHKRIQDRAGQTVCVLRLVVCLPPEPIALE
jgi:hypothetical protein